MEEISWEQQAEEFLRLHNWDIKEGVGFHPCYPLGEDFSAKGSMLKFCKGFYEKAWESYKSVIECMNTFNEDEETIPLE